MNFEANCRTTAMGVMPHKNPNQALELALSMDIPYWPQLPRIQFSEDMFSQLADGFPGATINHEDRHVSFDTERFSEDLINYSARMDNPNTFSLNGHNSMTYHHYLASDSIEIASLSR